MSTYIPPSDVTTIIRLSAEQIRIFLGKHPAGGLNAEAVGAIKKFHLNPPHYTDDYLVALGQNIEEAIDHAVRIEVRPSCDQNVTAQVVAKGIWGLDRQKAVMVIRQQLANLGKAIDVRLAGSSSFEFNVQGVDKSLPIRFLQHRWSDVLRQIKYTPGFVIDSAKTATIIAADGDGTIYEGPVVGKPLPMLSHSPVFDPLVEFLQAGGIFMLVSGNDLNRSIYRLRHGLPQELFHRVLIAGNGGADLVGLGARGEAIPIEGYATQSFHVDSAKNYALDIVYIGDDGSVEGNDWAAFNAVGFNRSVLVAEHFSSDYDPQLKGAYVGGLLEGTARYLKDKVRSYAK